MLHDANLPFQWVLDNEISGVSFLKLTRSDLMQSFSLTWGKADEILMLQPPNAGKVHVICGIHQIASILFSDVYNKQANKAVEFKNAAAQNLAQLYEVRASADQPPAEEQFFAKVLPTYERELTKMAKTSNEPTQKIYEKKASPRGGIQYLVLKRYSL